MFYRKWPAFRDLNFDKLMTSIRSTWEEAGGVWKRDYCGIFRSPDGFFLDMAGDRWYNLIH
jgi:hypothetical protein